MPAASRPTATIGGMLRMIAGVPIGGAHAVADLVERELPVAARAANGACRRRRAGVTAGVIA